MLHLWPLPEWPSEGPPDGLYAGQRAMTVQNYTEANVKNGVQYELTTFVTLPGSGTSSYIITTAGKPAILKGRSISLDGLGIKMEIFKDTTYTGGTPLQSYNLNTYIAIPSTVVVRGAPTILTVGTKAGADRYILGNNPAANTNVVSSTAFSDAAGNELILAPNTVHHFRTTSLDTDPQTVYSYNTWFEGTPDLP